MGKERGGEGAKRAILSYFILIFWIDDFLKEVLGLLAYEGTTFMLNARLYANLLQQAGI